MRKLTLEQWEKKYITGSIKRFDQKYSMYRRPNWDASIKDRQTDWSFMGEIKDTPGYTLQDFALRRSTRRVTQMLTLSNTSKPNQSPVSKAIFEAINRNNPGGMYAVAYRPPEKTRLDVSDTQRMARDLKNVALYFGADDAGICKLDRRWLYSHTLWERSEAGDYDVMTGKSIPQEIGEEYKNALVLVFEESYDLMKHNPTWIAHSVTSYGYSRMAVTNAYVSEYIRNLGFQAIDCSTNDIALTIPMAMQAGLGDIGRNGLLITPRYGPRVRISKILTDLPLTADQPIDFGLTEFCEACGKCADMCPSESIIRGDRTTEIHNVSNVAGALKWPINAETCRMYWGRSNAPCTNCIASCPYNKPDTPFHRTVRWFADHMRWADPFYIKMDDLFGYGKPKSAENFWDEWRPGH